MKALIARALDMGRSTADRLLPGAGADLAALLPSGRPLRIPRLPNLPQAMKIIELHTKLVSLSAMAVGSLAGILRSGKLDLTALGLLFFSGLCVDSGTTAFNSWFDFHSGVDRLSHNADTDKVIERHGIAPGWALAAALGLFLLGGMAGWTLALLRGWDILALGIFGMAVGFLYNGGPRPLSSTPFGEIFAGGALGLALTALSERVAGGGWSASGLMVGLPSFFIVASILSVNNACDASGDAIAGRRTLAIIAGPSFMRFFIPAQGIFALTSGILAWIFGALPRWSFIPLILGSLAALPSYLAMRRRGFSQAVKGPNMGAISKVLLIQALSLIAALLSGLL